MGGRKFATWTLTAAVCLAGNALVGAKTWTSDVGRSIEGELVSATEITVTLQLINDRLTNGTLYSVAIDRLSEESKAAVKEWQDKKIAEEKARANRGQRGRGANDGPSFVDNFGDEFPKRASADSTTEVSAFKEDEETEEFIYHTAHYEFICDAKLNTSVVRAFARMFEATFDFCRQLPISTQLAHQEAGENRHKIYLFADIQNYYKNGGPPGSAGVFMGDSKRIMVPLSSLGVEKAGFSSYRIDHDKGSSTLPHEIVHQLTDECYFAHGARGWFTEGLAEYVANTPYTSSGTFKVATNRKSIIANVTAYGLDDEGGRAIGTNINMMPLRKWMQIPYYQFTGNAQINYGMGCLVTYYFFHWDGDGDRAAITAFLKALRQGKNGEEALDALLMGRTWDELEQEITTAWRSKGVKINWAEDDGGSMKEKTGFTLE